MSVRERLFALERFGVKLGLDNITHLLDALNRPERSWKAVHVAGTNGKGSVTAMVERGLRAAGHRTGRYTSPHLETIEERVAIDGRPIDAFTFDAVAGDVLAEADRLRSNGTLAAPPTFFEATTAIAFEVFRRKDVDIAIIEVGMGGRFDATNAISPVVSVITSIAMDHERHLGTTLEAIAEEKAGIIKHDVPVVVGDVPAPAAKVIEDVADARGAPVVRARVAENATPCDFVQGRSRISLRTPRAAYGPLQLSLAGSHQVGNAVVAARTLEVCSDRGISVAPEHIVAGLTDVDWPGRLEWLRIPSKKHVLLDAAHNPAGAEALAQYLTMTGLTPLPLVIAVMQDKDVAGMLRPLAERGVASLFVVTEVGSARSLSARELAAAIDRYAPTVPVTRGGSPDDALRVAFQNAPRVVVTGSIFLVGPTRARLIRSGAVPIAFPL